MSTLAIIIICFLAGTLSGVILADKLGLCGDSYKGRIRFKQSGRGNVQKTDIKPEITAKSKQRRTKEQRKEDREKKRLDKKALKD